MNEMSELIPLVALLRYGSYRNSQMKLRQRLTGGEKPSEILKEEAEMHRLVDQAYNDVQHWFSSGEIHSHGLTATTHNSYAMSTISLPSSLRAEPSRSSIKEYA